MPKYGMETETRARRAGWPTWRWTCVTTLRAEMRGRFDDLKRWMLAIEAEIGRVKDGKDRNESATQQGGACRSSPPHCTRAAARQPARPLSSRASRASAGSWHEYA